MLMKSIIGIHHVSLKAKGAEAFERTVSFYRDILGLSVAREWGRSPEDRAVMLDTGAGYIEIFSNAPDVRPGGTIRHGALDVTDTDAVISAVRAAGYKITMEPTDIVIPSSEPCPARIAFFIGPLGEEIEIFQRK